MQVALIPRPPEPHLVSASLAEFACVWLRCVSCCCVRAYEVEFFFSVRLSLGVFG